MNKGVAIIILNYNGWKDTINCLRSIYTINYDNYHVIVVDNGSTDNSIKELLKWCKQEKISVFLYKSPEVLNRTLSKDFMQRYFDKKSNKRLILIASHMNKGYAGGMNIGIRFIMRNLDLFDVEYILLLNNDTIVNRNFLSELVKVMELYNDVAIAGPSVYHYYTKEFIPVEQYIIPIPFATIFCSFFNNLCVNRKHLSAGRVLLVNRLDGSCYMVRTKIFKEVGLLVEEFFSYWEDTEFFLRVKKKGYNIAYISSSAIRHKVGSGFVSFRKISPFATYLMHRNAVHFTNMYYRGMKKLVTLLYLTIFSFYHFFVALVYFKCSDAAKASLIGLIRGLLGETYSPAINFERL